MAAAPTAFPLACGKELIYSRTCNRVFFVPTPPAVEHGSFTTGITTLGSGKEIEYERIRKKDI